MFVVLAAVVAAAAVPAAPCPVVVAVTTPVSAIASIIVAAIRVLDSGVGAWVEFRV